MLNLRVCRLDVTIVKCIDVVMYLVRFDIMCVWIQHDDRDVLKNGCMIL